MVHFVLEEEVRHVLALELLKFVLSTRVLALAVLGDVQLAGGLRYASPSRVWRYGVLGVASGLHDGLSRLHQLEILLVLHVESLQLGLSRAACFLERRRKHHVDFAENGVFGQDAHLGKAVVLAGPEQVFQILPLVDGLELLELFEIVDLDLLPGLELGLLELTEALGHGLFGRMGGQGLLLPAIARRNDLDLLLLGLHHCLLVVVPVLVLVEVHGYIFDCSLNGRESLRLSSVAALLSIDGLHLKDGNRLVKAIKALFLASGHRSTGDRRSLLGAGFTTSGATLQAEGIESLVGTLPEPVVDPMRYHEEVPLIVVTNGRYGVSSVGHVLPGLTDRNLLD